jgi:hypothetical protein
VRASWQLRAARRPSKYCWFEDVSTAPEASRRLLDSPSSTHRLYSWRENVE